MYLFIKCFDNVLIYERNGFNIKATNEIIRETLSFRLSQASIYGNIISSSRILYSRVAVRRNIVGEGNSCHV